MPLKERGARIPNLVGAEGYSENGRSFQVHNVTGTETLRSIVSLYAGWKAEVNPGVPALVGSALLWLSLCCVTSPLGPAGESFECRNISQHPDYAMFYFHCLVFLIGYDFYISTIGRHFNIPS